MFIPVGPNAGPTGGAGLALPAWICSFTTCVTFFSAIIFTPLSIGYLYKYIVKYT